MSNDAKVRRYLRSGSAGLTVGVNPHECYSKAWGASGGLGMSLGDFTDCVHRAGFRPDVIRPKVYHLTLPDRPS